MLTLHNGSRVHRPRLKSDRVQLDNLKTNKQTNKPGLFGWYSEEKGMDGEWPIRN
jgi:hypothetical protein